MFIILGRQQALIMVYASFHKIQQPTVGVKIVVSIKTVTGEPVYPCRTIYYSLRICR